MTNEINQEPLALPRPLVSSEVDLRDFPFMPLDVVRLRDSDFAAITTGNEFRAALLLWCAAWHQLPAGSLPDDDVVLARLAGYGRVVDHWQAIRIGALHGWIKCADKRLYHHVISEKVLVAWNGKLQQRWKTECARIKKNNQRNGTATLIPSFEEFVSSNKSIVLRDKGGTDAGHIIQEKVEVDKDTDSDIELLTTESGRNNQSSQVEIQRLRALCDQLDGMGIDSAIHSTAWKDVLSNFSDIEILDMARTAKVDRPTNRIHFHYVVEMLGDLRTNKRRQAKRFASQIASRKYGQGGSM